MLRRTFLGALISSPLLFSINTNVNKPYQFGKMYGREELSQFLKKDCLIIANNAVYIPWYQVWYYRYDIAKILNLSYDDKLNKYFQQFICSHKLARWVRIMLDKNPNRKYVRFFRNLFNNISGHCLLDDPRIEDRNHDLEIKFMTTCDYKYHPLY